MPVKITAYECKHGCGKYLKTASGMRKHEKDRCWWNPSNRACASCERQSLETETVYDPHHGGDPGSSDYEVEYYCCSYFGTDLQKPGNLKHDCGAWRLRG